MTPKETATLAATAERLRRQLADAQAAADTLRARLTRIEARLTGEPPPETGLEELWKAAPVMARTRSSKFKCRAAWLRIPPAARPKVSVLLAAMRAWSRCQEWRKDDGLYVQGLHRWILDRRWEDLPESPAAPTSVRYCTPRPHQPAAAPEELATAEDIAAVVGTDWLAAIPQARSTSVDPESQ